MKRHQSQFNHETLVTAMMCDSTVCAFVQAFPVLSRILGENSLLNTTVGALVISAASVDEACVWCLLALVVSTVNAGSPLDAFYVFLLLAFFVAVMLTGE